MPPLTRSVPIDRTACNSRWTPCASKGSEPHTAHDLKPRAFRLGAFYFALIFALAAGRSWLSTLLASSTAVFLGDTSYSIYLAHPVAQTYVQEWFGTLAVWAVKTMTLIAIIGLAWILYRLLERPARLFLRRASMPVRLFPEKAAGGA